jgi:hypothetical protein
MVGGVECGGFAVLMVYRVNGLGIRPSRKKEHVISAQAGGALTSCAVEKPFNSRVADHPESWYLNGKKSLGPGLRRKRSSTAEWLVMTVVS